MRDQVKSLGDIISGSDELNKIKEVAKVYEVVDRFYEVFPDLKEVVVPVKIEKNVLYLRAENAVWRSELNIRQKLLVDKINKYFKNNVVKAIKFTSRKTKLRDR